jgi:hypothetical protein
VERELDDVLARKRFDSSEAKTSRGQGLLTAVANHSFELYKTWLLLVDALDLDALFDPAGSDTVKMLPRSTQAIAVRHWYSSASFQQNAGTAAADFVPVGLPGHFSIRGDWFLAVAAHSRSWRLADRALDLLSSRRANYSRLQSGIGLPTRDIFREYNDAYRTRTGLIAKTEFEGGSGHVAYGSLIQLGASEGKSGNSEAFYWLWRSGLKDYTAHARIWHKWLSRMAASWSEHRRACGKDWIGGFKIYDQLEQHNILRPLPWQLEPVERSSSQPTILDWSPVEKATYSDGESDATSGQIKRLAAWQTSDSVSYHSFLKTWMDFQQSCSFLENLLRNASSQSDATKRGGSQSNNGSDGIS